MGGQRGVLLLTIPAETADAIDYVTSRYGITQDEAIKAAVCALVGMIGNPADPGHGRALKYMAMVQRESRARRGALETVARREGG